MVDPYTGAGAYAGATAANAVLALSSMNKVLVDILNRKSTGDSETSVGGLGLESECVEREGEQEQRLFVIYLRRRSA